MLAIVRENARTVTIELDCPDWTGHLPGQHIDIRLTAEDGYQAQRSYSLARPPRENRLSITVAVVDDGEVSSYLAGALEVGDQLELRGPIGGYFVWEPEMGGPLQLVAGGSGIVPLMAMVRQRSALGAKIPTRLLASWRGWDDVIYRDELDPRVPLSDGLVVRHTLTRSSPEWWEGLEGRVDSAMLAKVAFPSSEMPLCYVCGPTGFVEAVGDALVRLGHDPAMVRTERFGPTGGS